MAKKISNLILILSLLFLLVIVFIIRESQFTSTTVKDITVTTCSFFTLILAIQLYDRFDYRKTVFQKKLEIVLDLLVELKLSTFYVKYSSKNGIEYNAVYGIDRNSLNKRVDYENIIISFDSNYLNHFINKIRPFINNPFMPKEIAESLKFLNMQNYHSINHIPDIDVIKFCYEDHITFWEEKNLWFIESSETVTLKSHIDGFINSVDVIENWIDKHSNIKVDLNI